MKRASIVFATLGIFAAFACSGRAQAADIAAGKAKAQLCAACHGANGVSSMKLTPSLAGQPDEYVQWQLVFFRSGARKSPLMQPIAQTLNNEDIRYLVSYYASIMPHRPYQTSANDAVAQIGAMLAKQQRCRSFH